MHLQLRLGSVAAYMRHMQRRAAEFSAGIGLMRMSLENEGWSTAWANDMDEKKWEMYRSNFNDEACEFILGDAHLVNGKDIPDIGLAADWFPCKDLSIASAFARPDRGASKLVYSSFV